MLPKEKWAKTLVISAYIILGGAVVYLFFGRLLSLLLPFIFALLVAAVIQGPAKSLCARTALPFKLCAVLLVLAVIFFLGFVVFLLGNQLISEAQRLFEGLSRNSEQILRSASELLNSMEQKMPFIYDHIDPQVVKGSVTEVLKNLISTLSSALASMLTAFVSSLPDIGLFFAVFVISCFYFAADFGTISRCLKCLPQKTVQKRILFIVDKLKGVGLSYLKAYAIILLITFAQLFVGFLLLDINYATTLAIVIALLDMLPIIGTGTVLIPWALVLLMMGRLAKGIGLLVLFGVITLVREFAEPKIIGSSMGLHPLATLIAMYAGYKLFGIFGLLILPPLLNLAKGLLPTKNTINYTPKASG